MTNAEPNNGLVFEYTDQATGARKFVPLADSGLTQRQVDEWAANMMSAPLLNPMDHPTQNVA